MLSDAARIGHSVWRHRQFALAMAVRDLKGSHRGSVLGMAWLVIRPAVVIAAYLFIVLKVFRVSLPEFDTTAQYLVHVLSGMVAWVGLQRCFEEAPVLVRDRMEVLKQITYPVETLPFSAVVPALIPSAVVLLALVALLAVEGRFPANAAAFPLALALLAGFMTGASWVLMIAGAVLRDLKEIIAVLMGLAVYASPIFFTERMVGPRVWTVIEANPLSHIVFCFQDVFTGTAHPWSWTLFALMAAGLLVLGAWLTGKVKLVLAEIY
jgi:lipopolysaccharide transport system permease protein